MKNKKKKKGVVHKAPKDLIESINSSLQSQKAWKNITPLARNEWICWVTSAKKYETRIHRIERTLNELSNGKRRPCCFAGCPHR